VIRIGITGLYRARGGSLTRLVEFLDDLGPLGALDRYAFVLYLSPFTARLIQQRVDPTVLERVELVIMGHDRLYALRRHWIEQVLLPRRARKDRIDVLLATANIIPYHAAVPRVVLFQNATPYCEGQGFRDVPLASWLRVRALRRFIEASARHAERVICISRFFRDVLVERTGMAPDRAEVVYAGRTTAPVEEEAVRRVLDHLSVDGPYLLMVSHLYPYKHVIELMEGFAAASRESGTDGCRLVIAGAGHDPAYMEGVRAAHARLDSPAARILLAGEVPGDDIRPLLRGALGFVFSSICENLPQSLLEALDMGLPIASSDHGVMPEVCGDAALYFEPRDPDSVAGALRRLMTEPGLRQDLGARARAQAQRFPRRPESTRAILGILEEAARP
jgi:glycosyltransferase involved in cell wall biosynthesis